MGVFEMVVIIVFIATVGKVVQSFAGRPSQPGLPGERERVQALEAELRANEARLAHTEEKLNELGEKLDFVENLLSKPERDREIPGPDPRREG